jgi:hypothetical protein
VGINKGWIMKNIIKKLVMMQSLLCSALFGVNVEFSGGLNYNGSAHEAFKIAEFFLRKKLFNSDECGDQYFLQSSFLKSLCYTQELCNTPSAYALACGDICADMLWIDGDYECRNQVKELASKIVYCPIDFANNLFGDDKYILATGCSEFKKFFLLCDNLKSSDNYSFAIVTHTRESEMHRRLYSAIVVEKCSKGIIFKVYGWYDHSFIEFLETVIMDDAAREKILVKSLQKYYSPALVKQCQQQFGLFGDNDSWWQRIVSSAFDGIKKLKVVDYLPSF